MLYVTHDQVEALTMGDRVAILDAGELEQVGTPDDVYRRPANRMVAGFVGSPAMNVIPATLEPTGLRAGPFTFPVPAEGLVVGPVEVGFRPEHVQVGAPGTTATVEVVEAAGNETFLYLLAGADPGGGAGGPGRPASPGHDGSRGRLPGRRVRVRRRFRSHRGAGPMRQERGLWLMLAPYLAGLAILVVAPTVITFALSAFEYDLIRPPRFNGLDNFRELLGDEVFHISLRNSASFALFAVPLRLLGALGLALLLHRRFRGVGAYRTAAYLPTVVPDIAYALVWLWVLNPLYGPLNLMLGWIGIEGPSWFNDPRAAQMAVVLMSVFQIGEGFLVALATRQEIPGELHELAAIEGSSPWHTFRRVTLPLMAPTLLLLLFRDTIYSFQVNFVPALIVTGGGPPPYATTYVPLFVYRNAFEYLRYGYAAAATLTMFVVTAVIVFVPYRLVRRWRGAFAV